MNKTLTKYNKFKNNWLIISLLVLAGVFNPLSKNQLNAQDPQFSQFYANYLYLAPSFAGLTNQNRFSFNYRDQWRGIASGFETFTGSFDHYFSKFNSGVGILALHDRAGTAQLSNTSLSLQYSYDVQVVKNFHLRAGMSFSYISTNINFNELVWGDQISAGGTAPSTAEPATFERVADIDFGTSILGYTEIFWAGMSIDHLLKPNQSLYEFEGENSNKGVIPYKFQLFGGAKYVAKQELLKPIPTSLQYAFLFKKQKEFTQLDMGLYWYRNPLVLGVWYRGIPLIKSDFNNDAIVMLIGYKTSQFTVGYSYDFTISRLILTTKGSNEISMSYNFSLKPIKRKHKMVPCPEF